ncbi:MAG: hypothetical protein HWE22_18920 [Flavobacteriales bacterium]|nr:hypothetical protein [Flavobacteriales bacterium]
MRFIKLVIGVSVIASILGSCTSEVRNEMEASAKQDKEVHAEETPPAVSYPTQITQRNVRKHLVNTEGSHLKYDSIQITLVNDSSYYCHYYISERKIPSQNDTLALPKAVIRTIDTNDVQTLLLSPFFSSGNTNRLFIIELDGKVYKVIEENHSCCGIWEPRGHVHWGSSIYFSLDFGILGVTNRHETDVQTTIFTADWDQETVDKLIEFLPLSRKNI